MKKATYINSLLFIAGFSILILVISNSGPQQLYDVLLQTDVLLLLGAILVSLISLFIKMVRWSNIFKIVKPRDSYRIYLIGQAVNTVAPIGAGELARALTARTKAGVAIEKTLTAALIERVSDTTLLLVFAMLCLSLMGPALLGVTGQDQTAMTGPIILLAAAVLVVAYSLLFKPSVLEKIAAIITNLFTKREGFIGRIALKISTILIAVKDAIMAYHGDRTVLAQTIVLTIMSWCIYGASTYLIIQALGMSVPLVYAILAICTSEIVGAFSFFPGGIGTKDTALALILLALGVPITTGIAVALLDRGIGYAQLGTGAFASTISFARQDKKREESSKKMTSDKRGKEELV